MITEALNICILICYQVSVLKKKGNEKRLESVF